MVARLRYNGGIQTISHTPAARQATATWELHDLRYPSSASEYVADSGSATLDAYSEAISGTAGPGEADATQVPLGATTGISAGGTYWLSDTLGGEPILLEGLVADTYAVASHPVVGTYTVATGGTLEGITLTASISAAISADAERMQFDHLLRIVWTYANGERHQQQVRVRQNDGDDSDLTKVRQDVLGLFPDLHQRIEHQGRESLTRTVATVHRQLQALERAKGGEPSLRLGGDERHFALVWRTLMHLAAQGSVPGTEDPETWLGYCRDEYNTFWGGSLTGPGGKETGRISRSTDAGTGSTDLEHGNVILGL